MLIEHILSTLPFRPLHFADEAARLVGVRRRSSESRSADNGRLHRNDQGRGLSAIAHISRHFESVVASGVPPDKIST